MAKIFISHSSLDKDIVDLFKNMILNAGLGIADDDIAYTSAPETSVPTGGNIPQYIKENIADSDFVFFMISDNYRKSEVCLNEMGAAWALDKNVKPILLYDVPFHSVGWLYGMNLCAKIDDADRLDELRDEFLDKYGSRPKTAVWNRQKTEFIIKIATLTPNNTALIRIDTPIIEEDEELGLLDYREVFDNHIFDFIQIMGVVNNAYNDLSTQTAHRTQQLQSISPQTFNTAQTRGIMIGMANEMNQMSQVIEENVPLLNEKYDAIIESAKQLQQCSDLDAAVKSENRTAVQVMLEQLILTKDVTIENQKTLNSNANMEKSQIAAKKRLLKAFASLINAYNDWITKTTELLKA